MLYLYDVMCAVSKIICVHTKFLNYISTFLSFFVFLSRTVSLHPPTKIPVLNDQLDDFWNGKHDVIQVEQKHTACCKKTTHVYYYGFLFIWSSDFGLMYLSIRDWRSRPFDPWKYTNHCIEITGLSSMSQKVQLQVWRSDCCCIKLPP